MTLLRALAALLALGACQSAEPRRYAVLVAADAPALAGLKSALAAAMGTAQVELGPGDPTQSHTVAVLPRRPGPHEDRSTAMPTLFDIVVEDGACRIVRQRDGAAFPLDGVACRPLDPQD